MYEHRKELNSLLFLGIPALLPVVEHVFFKSTNVTDPKDLETQKEFLLAMLLRLAEYPQVSLNFNYLDSRVRT